MPYIKKKDRVKINEIVDLLVGVVGTSGEMNYAITRFFHKIIMKNRLCYDMLSSAIGVLECVKLELYRMVIAPYENKKRMLNGPISDLDAKSLEDVR